MAFSFGRRKALALAFANLGTMAGSFIFPIVFQLLIDIYGWRGLFLIYSGFMLNTFVEAYVLKLCLSEEAKSAVRTNRSKFDTRVFYFPAFDVYIASNLIWGLFGKSNIFYIPTVHDCILHKLKEVYLQIKCQYIAIFCNL